MADDEDGDDAERTIRRLPHDQLETLMAALEKGKAREVVPDRPPAYATGEDAKILRKVAEHVVDERTGKFISEERIVLLINEINERFYERRIRPLEEKIARFLTSDAIEDRIVEGFKKAGLRIDEEHQEATADAMRGIIRWQKRFDKVIAGVVLATLGAAVTALLRLIGINLPQLPGGHS